MADIDLKKKSLVVKANELIECKSKLNITEQKIILSVISMINYSDDDFSKYKFKIKDFMSIAGIKDKTTYSRIRKISKDIMKKILEIKRTHSILQVSWFSSVEYFTGQGFVEFTISPELKPYLLELKGRFTNYQLINVMRLKSFYSIKIYELLKQYEKISERIFDLNELRDILCIEDYKYNRYDNFKRKILLVAKKEISEKTDLIISFSEIKQQRKVVKIKFVIKSKKTHNPPEKVIKTLSTFDLSLYPKDILEVLPQEYQINSIYHQIVPYFDDLDFLVSNIEYANKNCDKNYPAYLKLALKNDYAKVNREVKEKKDKIVRDKKDHILEKKNQEKVLKQKVWNHFNSLPEVEQFKFRSDAEEKMSAALKILKTSDRKNDIINAQIEKDMIVKLEQVREI